MARHVPDNITTKDPIRRRQISDLMRSSYGKYWNGSSVSRNNLLTNHAKLLKPHTATPKIPDIRLFEFASPAILLAHLAIFRPSHGLALRMDGKLINKKVIVSALEEEVDKAIVVRYGVPPGDDSAELRIEVESLRAERKALREELDLELARVTAFNDQLKSELASNEHLNARLDEALEMEIKARDGEDAPVEGQVSESAMDKLKELLQLTSTKAKLIKFAEGENISLSDDDNTKPLMIEAILSSILI